MSKPRVLLLGSVKFAKQELQDLRSVAEVVEELPSDRASFLSSLKSKYGDICVIIHTNRVSRIVGRFDQQVADHLPSSLRAICYQGTGYDTIDVDVMTAKNIQVSNVPLDARDAAAETGLYLILGSLRFFGRGAINLREGRWNVDIPLGQSSKDKTLGFLGFGNIGQALKNRCLPLNFSRIVYFDKRDLCEAECGGCERATLDQVLEQSDVISLNLPLNPSTSHILNRSAFEKMRMGVTIVNVSRGGLIDEAALVEALSSKKVRSVGLDVYADEPRIHPALLSNPDVLLLPHMGSYSAETRRSMECSVIRNVVSLLDTGKVADFVPEQKNLF